jgi:carbon storage regulator
MLILTRRAGEAILIDGGIRIVVLGTEGNGVRLGIEAPASIGIVREEVVQRMNQDGARGGTEGQGRDGHRTLEAPPSSEGEAESADAGGGSGSV